MYLSDEPIMSLDRLTYNLQSYMDAVLVKIATNLLNFAPNYGLAWQVVGYNTQKYDREHDPKLHDPCS